MDRERITIEELHARMKAQGVSDRIHIACKRVVCGTIQSIDDIIRATGYQAEEVEAYAGFSCIGRFTNAGAHKPGTPPGKGCDWTLGGLLRLHNLVVVKDGREHPFFDLATPEEAQAHEASKRVPA